MLELLQIVNYRRGLARRPRLLQILLLAVVLISFGLLLECLLVFSFIFICFHY